LKEAVNVMLLIVIVVLVVMGVPLIAIKSVAGPQVLSNSAIETTATLVVFHERSLGMGFPYWN
jgi:hypothetical protein